MMSTNQENKNQNKKLEILDEKEKKSLQEITIKFSKASDKKENNLETLEKTDRDSLYLGIKAIKMALDSFSSQLFVVSCIGMLKSGKSTLVNLLSGSPNASTTGFGVDTTLRPALIVPLPDKEEEESIEIWNSNTSGRKPNNENDTDNEEKKSALDELFLYLGGVKEKKELKEITVSKSNGASIKLTPNNLSEALTKKAGSAEDNMLIKEPLMVVVKVKMESNNSLFSSPNISILDTPGLDSGNSTWTDKDERYKWLIEKSDLILFILSSVAPMNRTAIKQLEMVRNDYPEKPLLLIYNSMICKPWQKDDKIEESLKKQQAAAFKEFSTRCGFDEEKEDYKLSVNLGKAYSAIFEKGANKILKPGNEEEKLLKESHFESLEQQIIGLLNKDSNVKMIRRRNCKNDIINKIKDINEKLENISNDIENKKMSMEKSKNIIDIFKRNLDNDQNLPEWNFNDGADKIEFVKGYSFPGTKACKEKLNAMCNSFKQNESYNDTKVNEKFKKTKEEVVNTIRDAQRKISYGDFRLNGKSEPIEWTLIDLFKEHIDKQLFSTKETENENNDIIIRSIKDNFLTEGTGEKSKIEDNDEKFLIKAVLKYLKECKLENFPSSEVVVDVESEADDIPDEPFKWRSCLFFPTKKNGLEVREELLRFYNKENPNNPECKFPKLFKKCEERLKEKFHSWINEKLYNNLRYNFRDSMKSSIDDMTKGKTDKIKALKDDLEHLNDIKSACMELKKEIEEF